MNNFDTNMENYKKMRYSRQREEIYEYLCHTMEHPSAEKIYQDLRIKMPNISLGTVYRNLKVLQELGKIKTIASPEGVEHYDADCTNHIHFICQSCGKIHDIKDIDYDKLMESLNLEKEFVLTKLNLSITGYCPKCQKN